MMYTLRPLEVQSHLTRLVFPAQIQKVGNAPTKEAAVPVHGDQCLQITKLFFVGKIRFFLKLPYRETQTHRTDGMVAVRLQDAAINPLTESTAFEVELS